MRMNAMIPMQGQNPDFAQSYGQGYQLGRQNAFKTLAEQYGAKAMDGDKEALNAFAAFDPEMGMGLAASRQNMDVQSERLQMARAEAARAAESHALTMSEADRRTQAEKIGRGLATVVPAIQSGNLEAVNQQLRTFGMDPVGSIDDARLLVAQYDGAYEAFTRVEAMKPKATDLPNEVRLYNFYADQERAAGREPMPYGEWRIAGDKAQAGGPQVGTIPQGYELFQDPETGGYQMRPIAGGPADTQENDEAKAEQTTRAGTIVIEDIGRVKKKIENSSWYNPVTGLGGSTLAKVPGTDAYDVGALLRTIGGNIGFDRLQQMRDASPTGGALGAINQQELNLLMSVMGSLEQAQGEEQLLQNLERLDEVYRGILAKAQAYPNAAEFGFGDNQDGGADTQQGLPDFSAMSDEELDAYIQKMERGNE